VIETPMVAEAPAEIRARIDRLMARQPIPRTGTPLEIAYAVLFFAGEESSYCTGSSLVVDGGHLAGPWREGFDD
jgi:3alpha(or 20beta)-hydroxysteroid dehydrogenase